MEAILKGEGISVGYQQNTIIQEMDVQIPKGQITSIIGPNGCGKSTLLKALSRMMPVKTGQVILDGAADCPAAYHPGWLRKWPFSLKVPRLPAA